MAVGVLLGAWVYSKHGWPMVWVGVVTVAVMSIADWLWGEPLGYSLGVWMRAFFTE